MKCSECSRRNHDDNRFCIYCGNTLINSSNNQEVFTSVNSRAKIIMPPQDIDEIISSRRTSFQSPSSLSIYPILFIILTLTISLSGVYYYFFYMDVFQILAIDYQTTNLANE